MTLVEFASRRAHGPPRLPPPVPESIGDTRFRRLVGEAAWTSLPAAVRARFSHRAAPGEATVYVGAVSETQLNWYGRLAANLLRAVGAPLPLDSDNAGASAIVAVTERPDGKGQFWTRQYARPRGFPQVIHSTKTFSGPTGLEERVGAGVTMSLRLVAGPDRLLFVSERYFLKLGRVRVPFPGNALLGRIIVAHVPVDGGSFDFTLEVRHRLFGLVASQRARFRDAAVVERAPC